MYSISALSTKDYIVNVLYDTVRMYTFTSCKAQIQLHSLVSWIM